MYVVFEGGFEGGGGGGGCLAGCAGMSAAALELPPLEPPPAPSPLEASLLELLSQSRAIEGDRSMLPAPLLCLETERRPRSTSIELLFNPIVIRVRHRVDSFWRIL